MSDGIADPSTAVAVVELEEFAAAVWRAEQALESATSLADVVRIRNQAEAIRQYADTARYGLKFQNLAAAFKLKAERRAGELLATLERSKGGRPSDDETAAGHAGVSEYRRTINDLKVAERTAEQWQQIASVPESMFTEYIGAAEKAHAAVDEITTAGLLRVAKQLQRPRVADIPPLPTGTYDVILADPPWEYSNDGGLPGQARNHYSTMAFEDICAMQLPRLAKDAALFLWVTNPMLREGLTLVERWGFEYKTNVVWVKTELRRPGVGFYVRGRHELLLICTRGSYLPEQRGRSPIGSVLEAPLQEHSRKPEAAYELIEAMYPEARYVELFARSKRDRWATWGAASEARQ